MNKIRLRGLAGAALLSAFLLFTVCSDSGTNPNKPIRGSGSFTDSRDRQTYGTIKVGNLTWMAENLNYSMSGSWCYGNNNSNCAVYGRLYTSDAAKTVCPADDGWRLPSRAEWRALIIAAGDSLVAGGKLKSQTGWSGDGGNGTDEFSFSALPSGIRRDNGTFGNVGEGGYWWSATERDASRTWAFYIRWADDSINEYFYNRMSGLAVRCVRE